MNSSVNAITFLLLDLTEAGKWAVAKNDDAFDQVFMNGAEFFAVIAVGAIVSQNEVLALSQGKLPDEAGGKGDL